jgi:hypothetical protein
LAQAMHGHFHGPFIQAQARSQGGVRLGFARAAESQFERGNSAFPSRRYSCSN